MAYSRQEKQKILDHYETSNDTIEQTAKRFSIGVRTLNRWLKKSNTSKRNNTYTEFNPNVKILFIDIETAPSIVVVYDRKPNFISPKQVIQHGFPLSVQYAWNDGPVHNMNLRNMGLLPSKRMAGPNDCGPLVEHMRSIIDKADIVVAHNGKRFDLAKINSYIIKHNLKPMHQPALFDTMLAASRIPKFESKSLDDLTHYLGLSRKHSGGFGYKKAVQCMAGNDKAWDETEEYGDQDIVATRELYLRIRPHATGNLHPNMNLLFNDTKTRCPVCGSTNYKWQDKKKLTITQMYYVAQCSCCGHLFQDNKTAIEKEKRESIVKSC